MEEKGRIYVSLKTRNLVLFLIVFNVDLLSCSIFLS